MIYVNGDSWSQISNGSVDFSWPKILEKHTSLPVVNESAGCGSNSRMLSNLHNLYFTSRKPQLVLIGLSGHSRWHLPSARSSSWSIGPTIKNDRTGECNEVALKWFSSDVYDKVEYVYQYYNIIWQINEFCKNYLNCPVIFFNAWDSEINSIEQELFNSRESLENWLYQNVSDKLDQYTLRYIDAFEFFKAESKKWIRNTQTWLSLLSEQDLDRTYGPHPNENGQKIIFEFVLNTTKEMI